MLINRNSVGKCSEMLQLLTAAFEIETKPWKVYTDPVTGVQSIQI